MNFEDRIKDKTLTKKEKIIADYILDNMETIALVQLKMLPTPVVSAILLSSDFCASWDMQAIQISKNQLTKNF